MPRENRHDSSHWEGRQKDTSHYWAGRQAYLQGNSREMQMQFDMISTPHGRHCAKELLHHDDIAAALDDILVTSALRSGFWLKLIRKVIYTKCNEVICCKLL